jgi:replicative DNA helicase
VGESAAQLEGQTVSDLLHSVGAEEGVVGALLIDPAAFARISETLDREDFYVPEHRLIFSAIGTLARDGKPYDLVTVDAELVRRHKLEEVGGTAYLGRIARDTPTSANVVHYAEIVLNYATRRHLIDYANQLAASCSTGDRDVGDLLVHAEQHLEGLRVRCPVANQHRAGLKSIELRDFLALEVPSRQYLIKPIIHEQGLCMLYGPVDRSYLFIMRARGAPSAARPAGRTYSTRL